MAISTLFLIAVFILTIGHLLTLKICSHKLDHRTAPLFISGWVLIGLGVTYPFFDTLFHDGWDLMWDKPQVLGLAALKGFLLYYLLVISQKLMFVSLSSRHYVTPLSIGLLTAFNYFLGETLTPLQLISCLGLFCLAAGFFFRGHLSDLSKPDQIAYFQLVLLSAVLGSFDHVITSETNWYVGLMAANIVLLALALALTLTRHERSVDIIKSAFFHPAAILAGVFYMATDLVKFYQIVTINPVTVTVTVQAMTKPVILVLSAIIWHERTVKEQLIWGVLAFIVILPLFF